MDERLQKAIDAVPAGAWAVGVSGGADSVALLSLLRSRDDLKLHVLHLDHETRDGESAEDAAFVKGLSERWQVDHSLVRRHMIEKSRTDWPTNRSARFRAIRHEFFRREVAERNLRGVLLAHHAEDQSETILQRLIRGSGPAGLTGMSARTTIGELVVVRPLLGVRRAELREHLRTIGQTWREDSSNTSDRYLRNRLRRILSKSEDLHASLLDLLAACRALRKWTRAQAPRLTEEFTVTALQGLPEFLARESATTWLAERGVPRSEMGPDVIARLIEMANDAASPTRQHFPGKILVQRRRGSIRAGAAQD